MMRKNLYSYALLTGVVLLATLLCVWLWPFYQHRLPADIIWGNGRVEGDEVIIATKFAGRLETLLIDEGSGVKTGQEIAQVDDAALKEQLHASQAQLLQIKNEHEAVADELLSAKDEADFAEKEFQRTLQLVQAKAVSVEAHEKNVLLKQVADKKIAASTARLAGIDAHYDSVAAKVRELQVDINEMHIVSPIDGRVLYKLAEQGEELPAGGRIAVLVNPNALYMTIYIPEEQVGRVKLGDPARIFVDAFPNRPFTAHVSFISDKAEFTPKEVQTSEERQRLVFRVKLRVENNQNEVLKSGMPGDGFIKTNATTAWPKDLRR